MLFSQKIMYNETIKVLFIYFNRVFSVKISLFSVIYNEDGLNVVLLSVDDNLKYALKTKNKKIINQAFEEIYYEYGHLIGFIISQYAKNYSDVEELINDVFLNHKKILEDEVNKDFTPPILSIFLEEKSNNERYVYFETSDNLLSYGSYNRDLAFKNTTEIECVSRSILYSVYELAQLPTKELIVSIIKIDTESKTLEIGSETNLKYLYYNDGTEGVDITTLQVGDTIKIEFDFLFEGYDPTGVYVKAIKLEQFPKVEVN